MATVIASPSRLLSERRFFTGMALAIFATVFIGFARSFFLRPFFPDWPSPPEAIFYIHGAVFTAWIALFIVQTSLIAGGRTQLHRRIGPYGGALAVAMVILGVLGALTAAKRASGFVGIPVPPLQFLAIPIFDMVLFAGFAAAAFGMRHDAQSHKRWMLLATISLVTAAIARWPVVAPLGPLAYFALTDVFVIALAVWDFRTRGRFHAVTVWGGLLFIASQPLRLSVMGTDGWLAFAQWATKLIGA